MMWAYCEGAPIGFAAVVAIPGPIIIKTLSATIAAIVFFACAWFVLHKVGTWDPKAWRVIKRARRYRNGRTGMLPARASWGSPVPRFIVRRH
jgi:hypothetical protein